MYHVCIYDRRSQKRAFDSLELELWMVMSGYVELRSSRGVASVLLSHLCNPTWMKAFKEKIKNIILKTEETRENIQ